MKKILFILFALLMLFTACGKEDENEVDYTYVDEEVVEDTGSIELAKEFLDYVVKGDKESAKKMCQKDFYEDLDDLIEYYSDKKKNDENYQVEFVDFKEEYVGTMTNIVFLKKSTYKGEYLEEPSLLHFNQQEDGTWLINGR